MMQLPQITRNIIVKEQHSYDPNEILQSTIKSLRRQIDILEKELYKERFDNSKLSSDAIKLTRENKKIQLNNLKLMVSKWIGTPISVYIAESYCLINDITNPFFSGLPLKDLYLSEVEKNLFKYFRKDILSGNTVQQRIKRRNQYRIICKYFYNRIIPYSRMIEKVKGDAKISRKERYVYKLK